MRRTTSKIALAIYFVCLTALLLAPKPWHWLPRTWRQVIKTADPVAHLAAFTLLGFAVCAATRGIGRVLLVVGLAVYCLATELMQSAWSVGRLWDTRDLIQNFAGLTLGCSLWHLLATSLSAQQSEPAAMTQIVESSESEPDSFSTTGRRANHR